MASDSIAQDTGVEQAAPPMRQFKSPAIHQTPYYRANAAYHNMLIRCENRDGKNPAYADVKLLMTRQEWLEWAVPRYEKFLSENPGVSPAAARNGDVGHYEIGNIEIVSFSYNAKSRTTGVFVEGGKVCSKCRNIFPLSGFYRHKRKPGGVQSQCKICMS